MRDSLTLPAGHEGFVGKLHDSAGLTELHSHRELEFNIVTSGSAYCIVGNRRVLLTVGTLLWLFPSQEHLLVDYAEGFSMWVGVLADSITEGLAADRTCSCIRPDGGNRLHIRKLAMQDLKRLDELSAMVAAANGAPQRFNRGISYLAAEAWHALTEGSSLESGNDLSPLVAAALKIASDHDGRLSLAQAAARLNASESWVSRSFRRETGVSFTNHCNRIKLVRFCELAKSRPGLPLTTLAYNAGFGSYAQFHRVFRSVYGETPREFLRVT